MANEKSDSPPGTERAPVDRNTAEAVGEAATQGPTAGNGGYEMAVGVKPEERVEHVPGVNASETDVPYVDPTRTDTAPEDIARTHAIAESGHSLRSDAGEIRRDVIAEKAFRDKLYEIINDPNYEGSGLRESLKAFMRNPSNEWFWGKHFPHRMSEKSFRALRELDDTVSRENPDIRSYNRYNPITASREVFRGGYDPTAPFREDDLETARRRDRMAEAQEEWAGILYDHPVDETYKAEHPDFVFGANEMMILERQVKSPAFQEELEELEQIVEKGEEAMQLPEDVDKALEVLNERLVKTLEDLIEKPSDELERGLVLGEHLREMKKDPGVSVEDFQRLARKLQFEDVKRRLVSYQEIKQVLEDVRSGRASQPPEPETPEQQAA